MRSRAVVGWRWDWSYVQYAQYMKGSGEFGFVAVAGVGEVRV